mmetsp:Transcript_12060/g.17388  ORF Transcript_12060/g.17388 Transcript_12060/m.17388 type:complete len:82 (-) Transcript_12060:282-527(-)
MREHIIILLNEDNWFLPPTVGSALLRSKDEELDIACGIKSIFPRSNKSEAHVTMAKKDNTSMLRSPSRSILGSLPKVVGFS